MNFESGRPALYHLRFASIGPVFRRTLPCGRNALYGDSFHPLLRSTNTVRFAVAHRSTSARLPKWVKARVATWPCGSSAADRHSHRVAAPLEFVANPSCDPERWQNCVAEHAEDDNS